MRHQTKGIIFGFLLLLLIINNVVAEQTIVVEFYYTEGCPSCDKAKLAINYLEEEFGNQITIERYEITEFWERWENHSFSLVPSAVIDNSYKFEDEDVNYSNLIDAINKSLQGIRDDQNLSDDTSNLIPTPFGSVNISELSLPVITIILGALDSFNPCSFFVLLFLLSLLVYVKSRRRMLLIGGIFVFFSGFIYFLFMLALFGIFQGIFLLTNQGMLISIVAGVLAAILGGINIKDFFFFKQGPTLSIPESKKPKLYKRMREIIKATYLPSMILGTIVLAIFANTYELFCTMILPVYFSNILTMHNLPLTESYAYILFYNIVYVIPLIIIVTIVTLKLSKSKLTEWQGRQLKLFSGVMMALLGCILLVAPALLNNVLSTLGILCIALVSSVIIGYFFKKRTVSPQKEKCDEKGEKKEKL